MVGGFEYGYLSILLGNGDGSFPSIVSPDISLIPVSVTVGDFNADGNQDLAVADSDFGNVLILLGNGDGSFPFSRIQYFNVGVIPKSVRVGDFNVDGNQISPPLIWVPTPSQLCWATAMAPS